MLLAAVKSNKRLKIKVRENCVAIYPHCMAATASCDSSNLSHVYVYIQLGTTALLWIKDIHVGKQFKTHKLCNMS